MKTDRKIYLVIGIGLITALFLLFLVKLQTSFYEDFYKVAPVTKVSPQESSKQPTTTLMFTGDVMLDRGVEEIIEKHEEDFEFPFLKIEDYLQEADLLFGNLESIVSDKGYQVKQTYPFRADPAAKEGLKKADFDVLSCANNHSLDYGETALKDGVVKLTQSGIDCAGAGLKQKAYSPVIKQKNDTKVAYLAYTYLAPDNWKATENKVGIAWLNEKNLKQGIQKAKEKSDLVVVSFHFGEEYEKKPNSHQKHYSHLAIDSGADLVIGHHPHVIQPVEQYKDGWIAYSLGNFVFDQDFSEETMRGLVLRVSAKKGEIKKVTSKEVTMNKYFQPTID